MELLNKFKAEKKQTYINEIINIGEHLHVTDWNLFHAILESEFGIDIFNSEDEDELTFLRKDLNERDFDDIKELFAILLKSDLMCLA
ncbi:MAG TPA: hypothetical protein P5509_06935 [Bacteroidales bacterium]|nr:hypothetical protein [Bacteroidales bacterium]